MFFYTKIIFKQLIYFLIKTKLIFIEINSVDYKINIINHFILYFQKKIFNNLKKKNIFFINEKCIIQYIEKINEDPALFIIEINKFNIETSNIINYLNKLKRNNIYIIILYKYNKQIEILNKINNFLFKKKPKYYHYSLTQLIKNKNYIVSEINTQLNCDLNINIKRLIFIFFKIFKYELLNQTNIIYNTKNLKYLILKLNKLQFLINNFKNIDINILRLNINNYINKYFIPRVGVEPT